MNIPNIITLARIALIPVLVFFFYLPGQWSYTVCAAIFAVASATDWLDGYLARKLNQSTPFGAFLDPVADKLMVSTALVLLVSYHPHYLYVIPAAIIIGREIVVSALREWMAELGQRTRVSVSMVGKVKTALQMVAITVLLFVGKGVDIFGLELLGFVLFYIATGLTLYSMFLYLQAAWPELWPADKKPAEKTQNNNE